MMVRIDDVKPNVSLDDLGHQAIYSAPASGDRMQNMRAFSAFLQRSFDRFNLTLDPANPIQEFLLIADDVCQLDRSPSRLNICSFESIIFMIIYPG
jgi:hypothetical protein